MKCFEIRNLTFSYPGENAPALRGLSLDIEDGGFTAICGASGCGKSTLLRRLKPGIEDKGDASGRILFHGRPLTEGDGEKIGFVMQDPDAQLSCDTVRGELEKNARKYASGGAAQAKIAEMVCFFGMQSWYGLSVHQLSGGQKQLLSLASVMVSSPDVLILDEPTSQLDPIAASEFIEAVGRINREMGTTVIICEHRLEEVFPIATDAAVMDGGRVLVRGAPAYVGAELKKMGHGMFSAMPAPMRVYTGLSGEDDVCPVSVRDGRLWLENYAKSHHYRTKLNRRERSDKRENAVLLKNIWFRYGKAGKDIVKGAELRTDFGSITAIVGGNGTGKSTTAAIIAGINRPYRGRVYVASGTMAFMPQNPMAVLREATLKQVFSAVCGDEDKINEIARLCLVSEYLERSPESLSGGERQRAALARLLLENGDILLLDEPTKGMDGEFKERFAEMMRKQADMGKAVIIVSHDLEFCAEYADECAMFFDGWIAAAGTPAEFFRGNCFYTTSASRMARRTIPNAVTVRDIVGAFDTDSGEQ